MAPSTMKPGRSTPAMVIEPPRFQRMPTKAMKVTVAVKKPMIRSTIGSTVSRASSAIRCSGAKSSVRIIETIEGLIGDPESKQALCNLLSPVNLQQLSRYHPKHDDCRCDNNQGREKEGRAAELIDGSPFDGVVEVLGPMVQCHLYADVEKRQGEGANRERPGAGCVGTE